MRTANKLVTDKRLVATEMIVELDTRMVEECGGEALVVALQAIGAKTHVRNLAHPRTVTWKRVVSKTYSTEMNAFVPTARAYLHDEPFVLWCLTANTLAEMIARNDVAPEVRRLKYAFPRKQVLVVVDGLDDYFRKIRLETKRSFAKQVRDVGSASSQPAPSAIGAAVTLPRHTPDAIDQALLQLNCTLDCNVMTTSRGETVTDWLVTYTREVAIRPYEKLKMRATPKFAVDDLGPSGKTLGDTWSRMLHMLWGVTPPIAEAVLAAYPTIDSLLRAYDEVGPERASRLLENVMVCGARTMLSY